MRTFLWTVPTFALLLVLGCGKSFDGDVEQHAGSGGSGAAMTITGSGGSGAAMTIAGSGGAASCQEDCGPLPPGWAGFALFAFGPYSHPLACPDTLAPNPGFEAFAGLKPAPHTCPTCACDLSETTCSIPTQWYASAAPCPGNGAVQTSLDAPPDWDGACHTGSPLPAGAMCNGAPCAGSVTVEAPAAVGQPCAPTMAQAPPKPEPQWETRALECQTPTLGQCPRLAPECRTPSGYHLCIYQGGDVDCPERFSDRHLLHRGVTDARSCSKCQCGAPEGGSCTVLAKAYSDDACGTQAGATSLTVDAGTDVEMKAACFDVAPGSALSSQAADVLFAKPGTCSPTGGKPRGTVMAAFPVSVCCRDDQVAR